MFFCELWNKTVLIVGILCTVKKFKNKFHQCGCFLDCPFFSDSNFLEIAV